MTCRRSFLALTAWALVVSATQAATLATPVTTVDRVLLAGHVLPVLSEATRVAAVAKSAAANDVTVTVVLRRADPQGFARFVADVYDRQSPNFRRFLTAREIADRFGPNPDAWSAVAGYFSSQGFALVEGSENRMTMVMTATRAQVERTFDVQLADFQLDGKRFFANTAEPSLPAPIARHVLAVTGLSDLASATRVSAQPLWVNNPSSIPPPCVHTVPPPPATDPDPLGVGTNACNEVRKLYYGFVSSIYNFFCSLAWNWFGICKTLGPLPNSVVNEASAQDPNVSPRNAGAGQTIGLVQFDSFKTSDVVDFLALAGAPPTQINRLSSVAINGGAPLGPNQSEVLLDINAVMTTASAANVVVYSAPFSGAGSFQAIMNRMVTDGVTIISNSWGYCENQTTQADVLGLDAILAGAAASGISTFTAGGDTGSTCLNGSPNTILVPAGSPHATVVGGTTATIGPGGTYGGETWWAGKGGFGVSRFFARPSFQDGLTASSTRSIPDLAINADPAAYGVQICQADAGGCPTGLLYGGTSASAPYMAAFMALLNESRGSNIGWLNPQIYPLAGQPAFHSAASMGSDFAHVGLGSPNGALLALALRNGSLGAVDAAASRVSTDRPVLYADGVDTSTVIVQLRDAQGVTVGGRTVAVALNAGSQATIAPGSGVTTFDNGTAVFTVRTLVAQTITVSATDTTDGVAVAQTVTLQAVAPPAASGGINATPSSVQNNGVAFTTITVTLRDALNRPTPGKVVTLAQGSGRSVLTAPNPAVTDVNGQIQFKATDLFAETVTYTAVDFTDSNVPVPGSATVTFSGQAASSCVNATLPTAAAGYTLTPFSTGYMAATIFYGNVNWGCRGASDPAFAADGTFYVSDFLDGAVFKLPAQGGVADSGQKLATLGPTLFGPVFGKDGRIYAARGATTGNFTTGAIYELDANNGAIVRTVFGGLTCPTALAVDPLSGDLFFDDSCFGAGSDNPSLFRLRNPGSASPTLEVYATLPTTPTGWIAIAPDGTIYMPQTLTPPAPVVRISGTDKPSPATVTPVPGLTTNYWVTVGETLPNGSAKSLIVLNGSTIQLADITTNPPTFTDLINTGPGSGKIGPDGCLYVTNLDTIYKLAPSAGGCGFAVSSPAPVLKLSPATASPAQGTTLTFTAQFVNLSVPAGTPVVFSSYGANAQQRSGNTDASGKATISYLGTATGTDTVVAKATVGTRSYESNQARIEWSGGKHTLFLSLNESAGGGTVGLPVMLSGTLYDISVTPRAPVPGATVQFSASGLTCSGVTDAAGRASCTVTPVTPGLTTQVASYGGSASFLSTSATQQFTVMAATASVAPLPVSLDFGSQAIGTTSATRSTVLTNAGTLAFTLSTIALAGSNAADFALGSGPNACAIGGTLAANGASCTLYLSFTPGATGSRGATVTVTDNAAASSVGVGLSGNGAGPTNNCFTGSLPVGGSGTACVTGVLPACQFSSAAFVPVTSVGTPLPSGVTVPFGLFQFVATGCGASLSLTITYPAPLPFNATYYKYGPELAQPSPHWYSLPATVNGNAMTVTLVDGGAGDSDLAANGTIVDPGGAGYVTAPPPIITPVPTLDRWTLLLLALLVAGTAFTRAARRR